jgi:hypothetical protein
MPNLIIQTDPLRQRFDVMVREQRQFISDLQLYNQIIMSKLSPHHAGGVEQAMLFVFPRYRIDREWLDTRLYDGKRPIASPNDVSLEPIDIDYHTAFQYQWPAWRREVASPHSVSITSSSLVPPSMERAPCRRSSSTPSPPPSSAPTTSSATSTATSAITICSLMS